MKSLHVLAPLLVFGCLRAPLPAEAEPAAAQLEERLGAVEGRLGLIERKLELLGAGSEAELLGGDELLGDPAKLLERAEAAQAAGDLQLAYRYLTLIHSMHPESPEDADAFPRAVRIFKAFYARTRYPAPQSVWQYSEPSFIFQWLGQYYEPGRFPQEQVDLVFVGMPVSLFDDFVAFGRHRPPFRGWKPEKEDDDGLVTSVSADSRRKKRKTAKTDQP